MKKLLNGTRGLETLANAHSAEQNLAEIILNLDRVECDMDSPVTVPNANAEVVRLLNHDAACSQLIMLYCPNASLEIELQLHLDPAFEDSDAAIISTDNGVPGSSKLPQLLEVKTELKCCGGGIVRTHLNQRQRVSLDAPQLKKLMQGCSNALTKDMAY